MGDAPPARLDKALAELVPEEAALSRTRIAALIAAGAVARLSGGGWEVVRDAKARPRPGEEWQIALPEPEDVEALPEPIDLDVIHEDNDLIVIDKPAGMVVHPAPGAWTGTLVNALLHHCAGSLSGVGGERRPGIVHRIDKDTSGLLVAAKTDRAHHGLAAQFAAHTALREYHAFVHGLPDRGDPRLAGLPGVSFEPGGVIRIEGNIARHRSDRQRMAVHATAGRHAVTRLALEAPLAGGAASHLRCWLETGRTHQIRVHAAHVGHALLGDPVYGAGRALRRSGTSEGQREAVAAFGRQALHAALLGFRHPVTGEDLSFASPLPSDMARLLETLSGT